MFRQAARLSFYSCVALSITILSGCSGSRDLTRSRAQSLIENSPNFTRPANLQLESDSHIEVEAKSFDEPEADVQRRAIPQFYDRYAVMAVLKQQGLISEKLTASQKPWRPSFIGPTLLTWRFKVEPYLTDKGKDLVNSERGASGGAGLPLYRRKVVEITGITKSADNKAEVLYTWRAVPTELGQTFDANGSFLKSLPTEQQKELRRPVGLFGAEGSVVRDYNEVFKGTARFQLFDDGWRLISPT